MNKAFVLDYPVALDPKEDLLASLRQNLASGHHQHVVTLNPEMLMAGEQNSRLEKILKSADLILPDGAGVVWALRHKKNLPVRRIPGIDFSDALITHAAAHQESIALIGASPEVNAATETALKQKYPGLVISYRHHGFSEDKALIAQECADTHPKYVFVALGVPNQEFWIEEFKPFFTQPTAFIGVGGSFDVWSGTKKRAPALFCRLNLEWLYRITFEPWRFGRVYKPLPSFVFRILTEKDSVNSN